jgi:hypothetical protein
MSLLYRILNHPLLSGAAILVLVAQSILLLALVLSLALEVGR